MKGRWFSFVLLRLFIISMIAPFVLGAEEQHNGVFVVERAGTWDKILCQFNIRECAYSNIGTVVFPSARKITEQSVYAAGVQLKGKEATIPIGYTDRTVNKGELLGFCAIIQLDRRTQMCPLGEWSQVRTLLTIDGQEESANAAGAFTLYEQVSVCHVRAAEAGKVYKFTKVDATAICEGTGLGSQGSKAIDYTVRVGAIQACTPHWECTGSNTISYVQYDCKQNSDRTCQETPDDLWACRDRQQGADAACVLVQKAQEPVRDGDGECEITRGETCTNAPNDCTSEPSCAPVVPDKPVTGCQNDDACAAGEECVQHSGVGVCRIKEEDGDDDGKDDDGNGGGDTGTFTNDEQQLLWVSGGLLFVIALIGIVYWVRFRGRRR